MPWGVFALSVRPLLRSSPSLSPTQQHGPSSTQPPVLSICGADAATAGRRDVRSRQAATSNPSSSRSTFSALYSEPGCTKPEQAYGGLVGRLVTGSRGVDVELFGPPAPDHRRLALTLKQAKNWQELSGYLPRAPAEWAGAEPAVVATALCSLARVATRAPLAAPAAYRLSADPVARSGVCTALRVLLQLVRPRLKELDAQGLASVAVSLAKMHEYCDDGAAAGAAAAAAEPSASSSASRRAASSSSGADSVASTSGRSHSAAASPPPLVSSALGRTPHLSASSSTSLTSSSFASLLNVTINELLRASQPLLERFSPQSLANLIWAMATLGHQPCGAWLTEYYRRLDDQLSALGSRDVSNILWSLCKLDLMPDVWLRDSLVERSLSMVRQQQQEEQRSAAAAQSRDAGQQVASSGQGKAQTLGQGQDRVTIIQCLARWYYLYNYRVPDEVLAQYLQALLPGLGAYRPFDLVSVVHSCVVMNHQPSRTWMSVYYAHVMRALKHDPTLGHSDLQRLLWALSRIDFTPPLTWQREFVAVSIPKLRNLNIRALSELAWALACWDCRPSPEWLAAYFNVSGPLLGDARPQHISCQLSALAKLDVKVPGPWLDAALDSFCGQLADARAHDLVTLLETIPAVCMDKAWLTGHTNTIKHLADTAASKFAVYDALMHTKLCVALAAANVCPAADWWKRQQQALLAVLRVGDVQSQAAAQELKQVYNAYDVEVDHELRSFL